MRILKETAGQDVATIVCGDFNHTPDQPGYDVMATGNINNKSLDQLQLFKVGKVNWYWLVERSNMLKDK